MPVLSAGILLYRRRESGLEVLLTHPGGHYWRNKDEGTWMIPKGLVEEGEAPLACALREFEEEIGIPCPGDPEPLARIRQKGGKWVEAYALEGDLDADSIVSNLFKAEWPPRSGAFQSFPEVDRAAWFGLAEARNRILPSQAPLLDALEAKLS
ncbi:MAG TPA: NUDIX domain-containing protein [Allosphingosinicella sp.]